MIPLPAGMQIWVACGATDMRKGFDGLAMLAQEVVRKNPHLGHMIVFRGKRADRIKILWWDGTGLCLYAKRLAQLYRPTEKSERNQRGLGGGLHYIGGVAARARGVGAVMRGGGWGGRSRLSWASRSVWSAFNWV
jgi:IS66 Orf2 like protein